MQNLDTHIVLAADDDAEIVNNFAKHVTHAAQANVTDEDFLKDMDVSKFDAAIVAVGSNMQVGIMTTVLEDNMGLTVMGTNDNLQRLNGRR